MLVKWEVTGGSREGGIYLIAEVVGEGNGHAGGTLGETEHLSVAELDDALLLRLIDGLRADVLGVVVLVGGLDAGRVGTADDGLDGRLGGHNLGHGELLLVEHGLEFAIHAFFVVGVLGREPVEVGTAASGLRGVAEEAEACAEEDAEVEALLRFTAQSLPGCAVGGIVEVGLVVAMLDGGTQIDDVAGQGDGLGLL